MTEDLGLVWLHVVSPPEIEDDLDSVSENWGDFGGGGERAAAAPAATGDRDAHAREPDRRARAPASRSGSTTSEPGRRPALNFKHTLMPHVPWQYLPDGAPLPQAAERRDPRPVEPVLQRPGPAGRAAPAPLPPDRLRRPRCSRSCGSHLKRRGHVGRLADRRGRRPRGGVPARAGATGAGWTRENYGEIAPDPALHQGARAEEGQGRTTPTSRRSTSCRRSSTS